MHCGIDCSRSGRNMPDLDPFQIWKFARTVKVGSKHGHFRSATHNHGRKKIITRREIKLVNNTVLKLHVILWTPILYQLCFSSGSMRDIFGNNINRVIFLFLSET